MRRRPPRSSDLVELAGCSCPHCRARSSVLHPDGLRRASAPLSLDSHFYSNECAKNRGAKGIRTPDLLHAMQTRYQLRHSPSRTPLESLMEEAGPAPQRHSLASARHRLGNDDRRPVLRHRRPDQAVSGAGPGCGPWYSCVPVMFSWPVIPVRRPGPPPGPAPRIRRGCHSHVAGTTWLGHPRLNGARRARITSHGSVLEAQGPGSWTRRT